MVPRYEGNEAEVLFEAHVELCGGHASKFAELLGEVLTDSTKKNLQMRVDAESGACAGPG